ncbi:hypothetical protein WOSG25_240030 [Weissella oryzae SG25]|uniref:Uncharacterized protein n=1 Tax=Weissella oryzae (strain DSM 25784 / JCM 18191 / LMG 30913 / SG25) TaxID=1329250 RepID=A0A069CX07_WEIOS|nr:DUF806 family protein [Weissella oryzae]GAK32014.1 hypothetical protein WOSG25_240030 [Weissella oryzae SG25]
MSTLNDAYLDVKELASWADKIYLNKLDMTRFSDEETCFLLRNSTILPDDYASNSFQTFNSNIQIQIFFGLNIDFDIETKMIGLLKQLNKKHWLIETTRPAIPDPDTAQLTATIIISKNKEIINVNIRN